MSAMQKIYIWTAATFAFLLSACADSDRRASGNFVRAALKVEKAAESFNGADYAKAQEMCLQAKSEVDGILADYPDSQIALRIVSQPDAQIGACSYRALRDSIIPRLEIYNNPDAREVSLAWAVASSRPARELRDAAYSALALRIMDECAAGEENRLKAPEKAVSACLAGVEDPELKAKIARRRAEIFGAKKGAASAKPSKAESAAAAPKRIADEAAFLAQARTNAALVSYDIRSIDKLDECAAAARRLSNPAEFGKILHSAFEASQKITMRDVRDIAMGKIAAAFVKFADMDSALEIAGKISSQRPLEEIMFILADNASKKDECLKLLKIAPRISNSAKRDEFYARLSESVADDLGAQAIKIAARIGDSQKRYAAMVKLGETSGNMSVFADAVAEIDLSASYDWISHYGQNLPGEASDAESIEAVGKFAQLARALLKQNPALAKKINDRAVDIKISAIPGEREKKRLTFAYMLAASNMARMGDGARALEFLTSQMHNLDVPAAFEEYAAIAAQAYSKDKAAAMKALFAAANIAAAMSGQDSARCPVFLAYVLQTNKVPAEDSVRVLSPFLPKFADK